MVIKLRLIMMSRREFLRWCGTGSAGFIAWWLTGCSGNLPVINPVQAKSLVPSKPTSVIQASGPDKGSTTVESLISQYWFSPSADGSGFDRSAQPAKSSPKNESISAAPPKAWYAPAKYFTDVTIQGIGGYEAGGVISSGDYQFVPLAVLQARAIALTPMHEGSGEFTNVYSMAQDGRLILQGILLPYALIHASVTGAIQDQIEGPMAMPTINGIRFVNRADLLNQVKQVQVNAQVNANTDATEYEKAADMFGNHYPKDKWQPPKKDHCGEDLTKLYALWLMNQEMTSLLIQEWRTMGEPNIEEMDKKFPATKDLNKVTKEEDDFGQRLKDKDCYFYTDGGSVYDDYKLMRAQAYLKAGGYKGNILRARDFNQLNVQERAQVEQTIQQGVRVIQGKFNLAMNSDQVLRTAQQIIDQYWW